MNVRFIFVVLFVSTRPLCAGLPTSNDQVVDHFVSARLAAEGIEPASQASTENLVRRLTLDLAGRIPSVAEVKRYLASEHPDRRERFVDQLMASAEFSDYMARRFDWFITQGDGGIRNYLQTAFQENRSWDQMFREILSPDLTETGKEAMEYLKRRVNDSDRLATDVSVKFFGVNISCAKCHDHPLLSDWTQDHFYGMKSFFARTFENGGFIAERDYGNVKFKTSDGDERQARLLFLTGTDVSAQPEVDGDERQRLEKLYRELKDKKQPPPPPKQSLRQKLMEVALQDGQDHFFAKAIVNRIWYQFFGQGLVMPLDQMHAENPPSHPELLEWLSRDLVAHGYDLRPLIRGLVLSETYSRSSYWEGDRPLPQSFAAASVRPLTPTQLKRSLSLATMDQSGLADIPDGDLQSKSAELANQKQAGTFEQTTVDFRVTANEALYFTNSSEFDKSLDPGLVKQLEQIADPEVLIKTAVWSILSRPPGDAETETLQAYISRRQDRKAAAVRQLVWSLLTSSEFRFNY